MGAATRRRRLGWIVLAAPVLLGMGSLGGQSAIQPTVDFHATVVDKDGTRVELRRVNVGGHVELEGDFGRGRLRIPFANITAIDFQRGSPGRTQAMVYLKAGNTVKVAVRNSLTFYGQTPIGLYEIRARDLKRMEFGP